MLIFSMSCCLVKEGDGSSDKDMEDGVEGSGDDEELGEADEDDSDLDLAWKMLDIARAIVEKSPEDTIEKVNILAALGEVAVERGPFLTVPLDLCIVCPVPSVLF